VVPSTAILDSKLRNFQIHCQLPLRSLRKLGSMLGTVLILLLLENRYRNRCLKLSFININVCGVVAASLEARLVFAHETRTQRVRNHKLVSSNLTIPNPRAKNGGSTVEEYGDAGQIFDNAENDIQHIARKSRWNSRLSGKRKQQISHRP